MQTNLNSKLVNEILYAPFSLIENLRPDTSLYQIIKSGVHEEIIELFSKNSGTPVSFGPFGIIDFPYFQMGAIDSCNLFDMDELILFNFYNKNKNRYKKMADMGANIGLHSLIACRNGFEVRSFEPDPIHFKRLQENFELNSTNKTPELYNSAVSSKKGNMSFCRVKGNTTGSHLAGAKPNPYGELDYFDVPVESAIEHMEWADLIKMDVEGHEPTILCATDTNLWKNTDAIVEIENAENAQKIFHHFQKIDVNLFAQKIGWEKVERSEDMPSGYREGSLFISCKDKMIWD